MEQSKKRQSHLSKSELEHLKELLHQKRTESVNILETVRDHIEDLNEADDSDYSSIAHHMGDVGSDVEEEELNYQLYERTQKFIEEIDAALQRMKDGTYGICQATGKPISKERLESVPHTQYSIEAKKKGLVEDK